MNNIEFDDQNITPTRKRVKRQSFADRLVSSGFVKTEQQANLVLVSFIVTASILIIIINVSTIT